ncbi:ornithine cyclodeaminase family protein [Ammoniphilus sp. YIM 78166]|uniref:ornithine cyclodeaminase family protein n=1 Tax=Ammoniphilus sp. YIM 78166 TaxID=1644106 RepID=UPI00106FAB5B|nr:ornithine cyclodeaminase family protein [Ammoniphilus sp. YIM 78166]
MLVLSANDQQQLLTMSEVIDSVGVALSEFSNHRAITPIRTSIPVVKGNGTSLFMPSVVEATDSLGVKFVSVFPDNRLHGKKTIYGMMVLADVMTGEPLAILEASYLTVLRTGAVSGLATKFLSQEKSKVLAIIGTGAQARGVLQAIKAVRSIETVHLYNRNESKAHEFAREITDQFGSESLQVHVFPNADEAVKGGDIVATATNAKTPVFSAESLKPGVHINAIGSFRPTMQEIPTAIVARASKIVVESREAALEETGDLIIPIEQGAITSESIYAELGEIVNGVKSGRESDEELTLFKSVGLAAMDVVVAKALYDRALELGVGQKVSI